MEEPADLTAGDSSSFDEEPVADLLEEPNGTYVGREELLPSNATDADSLGATSQERDTRLENFVADRP
jgi:hypothetical protein